MMKQMTPAENACDQIKLHIITFMCMQASCVEQTRSQLVQISATVFLRVTHTSEVQRF